MGTGTYSLNEPDITLHFPADPSPLVGQISAKRGGRNNRMQKVQSHKIENQGIF